MGISFVSVNNLFSLFLLSWYIPPGGHLGGRISRNHLPVSHVYANGVEVCSVNSFLFFNDMSRVIPTSKVGHFLITDRLEHQWLGDYSFLAPCWVPGYFMLIFQSRTSRGKCPRHVKQASGLYILAHVCFFFESPPAVIPKRGRGGEE